MRTRPIGIGIESSPDRVIASISRFSQPERVICYVDSTIDDTISYPCPVIRDQEPGVRMISDLSTGIISAAIRGTLPSDTTLSALKKACEVPELERIVLLETASGIKFFLAPVGIDEGWTIKQKLSLIRKGERDCCQVWSFRYSRNTFRRKTE